MKKFIAIVLMLASLFSVSASEFFPTPIPNDDEQKEKGFVLDYGTVFEVVADRTEKQDDGSTVLYYKGVEMFAYQAYGNALYEDGYEVVSSEQVDDYITIQVKKESGREEIEFIVQYFFEDKKLALIVPEGIGVVSMDFMSKFANYTEVSINEWFKLPGLGKMRFTDFELNGSMDITYYYSSYGYSLISSSGTLNGTAETYILGEFDNTSTGIVQNYMLPDVRIHYINEENDYVFDAKVKGAYTGTKIYNSSKTTNIFDLIGAPEYPSLKISDIGYAYRDIPDRVRTSTDGAIVITIDYEGEQYALYIRK